MNTHINIFWLQICLRWSLLEKVMYPMYTHFLGIHCFAFFCQKYVSTHVVKRRMINFLSCSRGVAAIEFAIALPFIMLLTLGGFEMTRQIIINQKLEKSCFTISDIVTQSQTVTKAQLAQTMMAAEEIMMPYDFPNDGLVIVTSVTKAVGATPKVSWQYTGGGKLSATTKIGAVGAVATLPNGLVLNDKDNIIISEIFYHYTPFFQGFSVFTSPILYKVIVFKPRLGTLTTPPA